MTCRELNVFHLLSLLYSSQTSCEGGISIPILWVMELKLRDLSKPGSGKARIEIQVHLAARPGILIIPHI